LSYSSCASPPPSFMEPLPREALHHFCVVSQYLVSPSHHTRRRAYCKGGGSCLVRSRLSRNFSSDLVCAALSDPMYGILVFQRCFSSSSGPERARYRDVVGLSRDPDLGHRTCRRPALFMLPYPTSWFLKGLRILFYHFPGSSGFMVL